MSFRRTLDFRTAKEALIAIIEDPDDTKQAFRIVQALGGPSGERMFQRFKKTELGAAILRDKRDLLPALKDTARLEALPANTLGRAYLEFLRSQQITADGLVAASEDGYGKEDIDEDHLRFSDHMRDMHDLWHVVGGYRGDLIGEAAVLAMSFAQVKNPGAGLIALLGFFKIGAAIPPARKIIAGAFFSGVRAKWLLDVDWEDMLARPLDDVRRIVGLENPPAYDPIYTAEARAMDVFA